MSTPDIQRPAPAISDETRPYWDGLQQGRLLLQRCSQCGKIRHYPRPMCDACYSMKVEWIEASGTGTIHSWLVAHQAFHPGFKQDIPYTLITVDLPEGVRVQARLRRRHAGQTEGQEAPPALRCGQAVHIEYERVNDDYSLPVVVLDADCHAP